MVFFVSQTAYRHSCRIQEVIPTQLSHIIVIRLGFFSWTRLAAVMCNAKIVDCDCAMAHDHSERSAEENPLHSQIEAANFAVGQEFLVPLPPSLLSSVRFANAMRTEKVPRAKTESSHSIAAGRTSDESKRRHEMATLALLWCDFESLHLAPCGVKCVAPPLDWSASLNI